MDEDLINRFKPIVDEYNEIVDYKSREDTKQKNIYMLC